MLDDLIKKRELLIAGLRQAEANVQAQLGALQFCNAMITELSPPVDIRDVLPEGAEIVSINEKKSA